MKSVKCHLIYSIYSDVRNSLSKCAKEYFDESTFYSDSFILETIIDSITEYADNIKSKEYS